MAKPHSALIGLAAGRGLAEPASPEALRRSALDHRVAWLVGAEVRVHAAAPAPLGRRDG